MNCFRNFMLCDLSGLKFILKKTLFKAIDHVRKSRSLKPFQRWNY